MKAQIGFYLENRPYLLFGAVLLVLSGFGQTYFISLFGAEFRSLYAMSDGQFGAVFGLLTMLSAALLPWLGGKIDHMPVAKYTLLVAVAFAASCVLVGLSSHFLVFVLALFFVRFFGQGLMAHIAYTATAKALPGHSGKAISAVTLFDSLAIFVIPMITVWTIGFFGWRTTWVVTAVVIVAGASIALRTSEHPADRNLAARVEVPGGMAAGIKTLLGNRRRVLAVWPALLAISFVWTGILFHQARLVEENGWPLSWFAGCLALYAATHVVATPVAGWLIDRFGPLPVVRFFLIPQIAGLMLLGASSSPIVLPAFLILTALSSAVDTPLGVAALAELYGYADLGKTRALFEGVRILVTGAAPFAMGALLDVGVPMTLQAVGYALALVLFMGSAFAVLPREHGVGRSEV